MNMLHVIGWFFFFLGVAAFAILCGIALAEWSWRREEKLRRECLSQSAIKPLFATPLRYEGPLTPVVLAKANNSYGYYSARSETILLPMGSYAHWFFLKEEERSHVQLIPGYKADAFAESSEKITLTEVGTLLRMAGFPVIE